MAILHLIISFISIFIAYKLYNRLRYKLPPGPSPLPFVGNLYDIKSVFFRCFADWSRVYGPIISVYFGSHLNVIVNNSELAKEVLKDQDQHLANRNRTPHIEKRSRNGTDLIWSDYGPHYVKVRKMCVVELFSTKRLEALRPIREDEVTAMVETVFKDCTMPENKGKPLVLRTYLGQMAFLHITRLTFGKRFLNSNGEIDELGQEMRGILGSGTTLGTKKSLAEYIPFYKYLFKAENDAFEALDARADRFAKKIMEEHTLARKKTGNTKNHFIDAMLTIQNEYELSEDTIIGLLWNMIAAGMDTTSITVEWAMTEMVRNPTIQQKVQEELDRVIGNERIMTEADIPNLPYLQCVIKECFRMHPPTPLMLPHKANTDVKLGGYDIPNGTTVSVNIGAIARDPKVWKKPLEFTPERFLKEDVDMKGNDFRLIPFGSGRRICPGAQLGIYMVTSMLGQLLHHFTWALPDGMGPEDVDMMEQPGAVAHMRTPLQAIPTPRLPAELYKRVAVGTV
ncbi:hypothetical protein ACJIZ3_005573 [Penstemon smallii]|uniref:Cytochrome P450 n=1 Tax=Penstemon smallii TaxID=265156 RepID=A0ABD3S5B0_9LAMI